MNYYMAFGGTSYGRDVGGPLIVTSYDYDVQINEYLLPAEPKYSLTQHLHRALHGSAAVILAHDLIPQAVPLSSFCESHSYDQHPEVGCVMFLSNWGTHEDCVFEEIGGTRASFTVPAWSVSILSDTCASTAPSAVLLLNTKVDAEAVQSTKQTPVAIPDLHLTPFELLLAEPIPSSSISSRNYSDIISSPEILDQLVLTNDETDYLWTSSSFQLEEFSPSANLSFSISTDGGPVLFVYVNGQLAASSIDDDSMVHKVGGEREQATGFGADTRMQFNITGLMAGTNTVDILFASMGLKNYGPVRER